MRDLSYTDPAQRFMAALPVTAPAQGRRRSNVAWQWTLRLGTFAVFFLWWQLVTKDLHSLLLPTFTKTVAAAWDLMVSGVIWEPLWTSNQALIIGYAISVVLG